MKKVSALLLTAMLGSSMVFAGVSGSATTKFNYNLDDTTYGITNSNDVVANFEFSTEDSKISEGDVHAEIEASAVIKSDDVDGSTGVFTFSQDDFDLTAKIVGPNWSVNILEAEDLADYASDFDLDDDDDAFHNVEFVGLGIDGVTVDYTYEEGKAVKVALSMEGDIDNLNAKNYVAIATPEFMLSEGLTVEAAMAIQNVNSDFDFGAGMKMAMSNEEAGYDATVAADMKYMAVADKADFELAANVAYSLATVDAYFATTAVSTADVTEAADYTYNAATTGKNLVSVKVTADLDEVVENVPVTVYAQLSTLDAMNAKMNAGADYTMAMDMASLKVSLETGLEFTTSDWMIGGDVEYTAADDAYVACAGVDYKNTGKIVTPTASVESTTLVSGATLKVAYDALTIDLNNSKITNAGNITASCEIEF